MNLVFISTEIVIEIVEIVELSGIAEKVTNKERQK